MRELNWSRPWVVVILGLLVIPPVTYSAPLEHGPRTQDQGTVLLYESVPPGDPCLQIARGPGKVSGSVTLDAEAFAAGSLSLDISAAAAEPRDYFVWFWYGGSGKCAEGAFGVGNMTVDSTGSGAVHLEQPIPGFCSNPAEHLGVRLATLEDGGRPGADRYFSAPIPIAPCAPAS